MTFASQLKASLYGKRNVEAQRPGSLREFQSPKNAFRNSVYSILSTQKMYSFLSSPLFEQNILRKLQISYSMTYVDLPGRSLLLKCHVISRYMHEYNFIYACQKNMAFSKLIFTKFTYVQQHYSQMSHTEFHCVNLPINMEITFTNSFTPPIKTWLFSAPIFTKLVLAS